VIGLGGWIILSEAIRLDDVRILERRAKLEHARKLQEAERATTDEKTRMNKIFSNLRNVTLSDWDWRSEGYVPIMFASFTLHNHTAFDIQDVEITCDILDNTGQLIDWNIRTVHEIISANSSKAFENFSMGYVNFQGNFSVPVPVTSTNCRVTNFALAAQSR